MWVSATPMQQQKSVSKQSSTNNSKPSVKKSSKTKRKRARRGATGQVRNQLRKILNAHGHTQNDLAKKTKVSFRVINDAYKKRANPNERNQVRIVNALERLVEQRFDVQDVFPES